MAADSSILIDFTLPSLGSDMEAGTVIEWLVSVGDVIHKGDVLVRVDTEKADIDIETWQDGFIAELVAQPGQTLAVGETLARISSDGSASVAAASISRNETMAHDSADPTDSDDRPDGGSAGTDETSADPADPFAALILDDDEPQPSAVTGSPADEPRDRPHAASSARSDAPLLVTPRLVYWPTPSTVGSTTSPHSSAGEAPAATPVADLSRDERRQQRVAELMERSNREIPHFHLSRRIDLTVALERLAARNANVSPTDRILPAAVILHAVAAAAAGSVVNGHYQGITAGSQIDVETVDLGVAVNLRGGGLVTPTLPAANAMDVPELMRVLKAAVSRAKTGRMTSTDMISPSLTVTNLGDAGVDRVYGVIRPPQRALVGFGTIAEQPSIVGGACVARSMVDATLSADHRMVNGHAGARFLGTLAALLEDPDHLSPGADPHNDPQGETS